MKVELRNVETKGKAWKGRICVDDDPKGSVGCDAVGEFTQDIERGTLAGINAWLANNIEPKDDELAFHDLESWCFEQIAERAA